MRRPRFSLRSMFVAVALVGICTLAVRQYLEYYAPGSRYQRTMSTSDLREALAEYIEPGSTYAEVARHIGRGKLRPKTYVRRYLKWQEQGKIASGTYKDGDRIVHYKTDSGVLYDLHFREGRLVNFDPKYYAKPANTISALSDE